MNRKMPSAVTKTQNRRMQIGKTDNEKTKWGSLGPRHANEIKNWCFGAIGANISRQIQIYTSISIHGYIHWARPGCKQMSFNKLKMWANWRMASERARGWAGGGGLSPMGVWKVRCFSMPDWFCGVGGGGGVVCGWQAPPGSQAKAKAIPMQPQERQTPPDCRQLLTRLFDEVAKAASICRWRWRWR